MKKYFVYDDEYISGWQYFGRSIINSVLAMLVVGLYLESVTAYKRAKSLGNSETTSKIFAVWGFFAIIIAVVPGGVFINIIPHWYLWFSNGNPKKSTFTVDEPITNINPVVNNVSELNITKKKEANSNTSLFNEKVKQAFADFESDLNSKKFKDYPVPFWYDIVKVRSESMKLGNTKKSIIEVQNEWTWMHADEYTTKYQSASQKDILQAMSLRIERFGYIYKILVSLENKLFDLVKKYNISKNPFLDQFDWDKASALASLNGSIKFALENGMSNAEISKFYTDFKFDKNELEGEDPFLKNGYTKDQAYDLIKDKLGVDMDDIKSKNIKIKKRLSSILSKLELEKRYAVFTILLHIANSDGLTDEENVILNDIRLELEIDIEKYNNSKIDGNKACNLLQDLDKAQKEEISKYIAMVVGADGDFSSQEMLWVNDVIRELSLDNNLVVKLTDKYWNKKEVQNDNEVIEEVVLDNDFKDKVEIKIITYDQMNAINEDEIYLNEKNNPFTGLLQSPSSKENNKIECQYVEGKRHGEYIEYDNEDEDKISYNKFYRDGKLNGPETYWWEKYKDSRKVKETKYSEDSNLGGELGAMMDQMMKKHDIMRQINYKDGLLDGRFYDCNWNGGLNFELFFKQGKKDGVWNQYFQTPMGTGQGALKKVSVYKLDEHISSIYYDIDNDEISKEEALDDDNWGGEAWSQDQSFKDW